MYKTITGAALAVLMSFTAPVLMAGDLPSKTVEQIYAEKDQLAGKRVLISGEVVKVNNGIMGKNFLHIQDGTGGPDTKDVTVTSQQTAQVGDKVQVEATVITNRDFGMGYSYAVILEEATVKPAK